MGVEADCLARTREVSPEEERQRYFYHAPIREIRKKLPKNKHLLNFSSIKINNLLWATMSSNFLFCSMGRVEACLAEECLSSQCSFRELHSPRSWPKASKWRASFDNTRFRLFVFLAIIAVFESSTSFLGSWVIS